MTEPTANARHEPFDWKETRAWIMRRLHTRGLKVGQRLIAACDEAEVLTRNLALMERRAEAAEARADELHEVLVKIQADVEAGEVSSRDKWGLYGPTNYLNRIGGRVSIALARSLKRPEHRT